MVDKETSMTLLPLTTGSLEKNSLTRIGCMQKTESRFRT